ncbi:MULTISPECIES: HAD-IA family hydrolase [unclassified Frondihabitans]|uniref:HAD-IA family hydrolase n=1 Tax=unclassified Frondihabitans TaxID=2626248 RepID=UPI000F4DF594|nr:MULTISPECIES: HAD-IA family hydrolase [unclassified Frondihabitans]RPE78485.1 sugar-phosphatase [Frondihabitans sp. PhB153]RPF08766.1 sugar-phosphatase [Frondihabitans sp. PhB161]
MTSPRTIDGTVFDAILFDMDGTLISSTPAVERSWARWGREYGLPVTFREDAGHGKPARDIVSQFVPADEIDAAYARIVEIEVSEVDDIAALPGAAEALAAIGPDRSAIVTSSSRILADARLAASGLDRPATVVTFDDVSRGKPDPEPFVLGATSLGFDAAHCLVVEDAVAGLQSGRAAGAATLAVVGTLEASQLDADLVVSGLDRVRFTLVAGGVRVDLV